MFRAGIAKPMGLSTLTILGTSACRAIGNEWLRPIKGNLGLRQGSSRTRVHLGINHNLEST